jgi:signal transduction histidine kinase
MDDLLIGLDDLPDGVVVADAAGTVVAVNLQASRLLGLSQAAGLGCRLDEVLPLADSAGRGWWACSDPYHGLAIRTGHPEVELYLPSGQRLLVTARYVRSAGPLTAVTSVVVSLRPTSRDRSQRDRAELVATVAHELRSPLTSVKGFTATLLAKWDLFSDAQRRLMLETVEADADRVTRLITELLDVARIDSGRLDVRSVLVDLPKMLEADVDRLVARGEDRERFELRIDAAGELPETWADADKLDQVFLNLLENAVRHGSGLISVRVSPSPGTRAVGTQVVDIQGVGTQGIGTHGVGTQGVGTDVVVRDEGDGIPAAARGRVFSRFWRSGRRGGTGLGLYIAKGLVEAHGGTIAVVSEPDEGAAFRVFVPAGTPPG